jgi:hypothetical protein
MYVIWDPPLLLRDIMWQIWSCTISLIGTIWASSKHHDIIQKHICRLPTGIDFGFETEND